MKNRYLAAGAVFFLMALLLLFTYTRTRSDEMLADRIAPSILRFHVLANSDSDEDQDLKLQVKAMLLDYMAKELADAPDSEAVRAYVKEHGEDLEHVSEEFMASKGYSYPARVSLAQEYFPTKTYGDMTFPCGTYEALRVVLGEGQGHNWWCVLYPPMCFIDITYGVVPDASKELLKEKLDPADYEALTIENHRDVTVNLDFRLFPGKNK